MRPAGRGPVPIEAVAAVKVGLVAAVVAVGCSRVAAVVVVVAALAQVAAWAVGWTRGAVREQPVVVSLTESELR